MPKRSLSSANYDAKQIEQLNRAVDALLTRTGELPSVEASVQPLLKIAAVLRDLPSKKFKARLKSDLKGKRNMSNATGAVTFHPTASPHLAFKDPARAIEFYKNALGAREVFRFEVEGKIAHAEMAIGQSSILLAEEWPEGGRFSVETLGSSPILLVLRVDDVDSFAEHAVSAGMKVKVPLKNQFYGHRDVTMVDPFGYSWRAVTVTEEMSVEEMHRRLQEMTAPKADRVSDKSSSQKAVSPVPSGYRMVTPYLVASDGPALLEFVKASFGAEEMFRAETATGVHGEVRIGDSMVMIGGGIPGGKPPATLHPTALHVYVEDIDAVYQKALAAGATQIDEPRDHEYGERSASVKDAAGNYWYIATHKGESYVPRGLNNVNVYLHPRRAEPLISFLERAFGAHELAKYAAPDGVIIHAEIRVGDSVVEMGEAHGKYEPLPAMTYLYVPDCDTVYRRAIAAGAKSLQEPADQPYGDRNSTVTDAFGNTWCIATHVKDLEVNSKPGAR